MDEAMSADSHLRIPPSMKSPDPIIRVYGLNPIIIKNYLSSSYWDLTP